MSGERKGQEILREGVIIPWQEMNGNEEIEESETEIKGGEDPTDPGVRLVFPNAAESSKLKKTILLGAAGVAGGIALVAGAPVVLGAVGFGSAGVAAGSLAASYQSAFLGGLIAKGSLFALCQSIGAAGLGTAGTVVAGATGAAAGSATASAGYATSNWFRKRQAKSAPVPFKRRSLSWRKKQADTIKSTFSLKAVPVILQKHEKEDKLPMLQAAMFVVSSDTAVTSFCTAVGSLLQISQPDTFLLLGTDNIRSMAGLYAQNAHDDGFLYVTYQSQVTY